MAIETVVDFANEELVTRTAAVQDTERELAAASDAARDAVSAVADLGTRMTAETDNGLDIRRRLATTASAADADGHVEDLPPHEILAHALSAALATSQQRATLAQARVARAATDLARARAGRDEAEQRQKTADARARQWKETVTDPVDRVRNMNPAFTLAVDAVVASKDYIDARDRVEREVPQKLRTEARTRAQAVRAGIDKSVADEQAALTAAAKEHRDHRGKSGTVLAARMEAERKERLVRDVAGAERDLEELKRIVKEIATAPPLSGSATKRIGELKTAGEKAITDLSGKTAARDAARAGVERQKKDIDHKKQKIEDKKAAIAEAASADRLALQDDLATLEGELTTLEDDLPAVEAAYETATEEYAATTRAIDLWEDAVPDEAWLRLVVFDDVTRRLDDLKKLTAQKIDDIRTEYRNAEKALVLALQAEAAAERAIRAAEATVAARHQEAAVAQERRRSQLIAAVRGDA